MSITLTAAAAKQIKQQLIKRGSGIGLKLGVKKSGCSGYAYTLAYAENLTSNETTFEQLGVQVIVTADDLPLLAGIELDYRYEGLNAAFKFNNPNVTAMCGCGESFAV